MKKINTQVDLKSCAICAIKSFVACSMMVLAIQQIIAFGLTDLLTVCLAVPVAVLVYAICCAVLKIEETKELLKLVPRS